MRKCVVALLFLTGLAAGQKIPLLHRDHVDTERAALHEKLTRLSETRKSMGMAEGQPSSAAELDVLTDRTKQKKSGTVAPKQRAKAKAAIAENAWPPAPQVVTRDDQEPSLGEVARKYRAQKRQAAQQ